MSYAFILILVAGESYGRDRAYPLLQELERELNLKVNLESDTCGVELIGFQDDFFKILSRYGGLNLESQNRTN